MSTNYYIGTARNPENEHIGKTAMGWAFSFNGRRRKTVADWRERIANLGAKEAIYNEYGSRVDPDEFWAIVESTRTGKNIRPVERRNWNDEGFSFSNYEFC